jgi:iron complex transport system ATP-binding protein
MGRSRPVINVRNLRVERDITILDGISWRVERGQHWCILGANGSGKTSLLAALTAYLPFSSGEVSVQGRVYGTADWRELRKRIGLVSSSILQRISDAETALETVVSGKYAMVNYRGEISSVDRRRAMGILKHLECDHLAHRVWRKLSQGERQRIGIGRAMMANLQLLLLDEPCASLDPVARENFLRFLERLVGTSASPTLVLVTHHIDEIVPPLSHALVLKSGRILASGPKEEVLTSSVLSAAFDAEVTVVQSGSRYTMAFNGARR